MKQILITILILFPLFSFSQNGVYHAINNDSLDYKCEIIVFEDSNYLFQIKGEINNKHKGTYGNITNGNEIVAYLSDFSIIYSYGLIIKTNNGFILEDKTSKLKLYLNKDRDYFIIQNSPLFLSDIKFRYNSDLINSAYIKENYIEFIEKSRSIFIRNSDPNKDEINQISFGNYFDFRGSKLELNSNYSYNLKSWGLTISRGKYEIKDNKIYFIDNDVKHTFLGKIRGKEIAITDLPNCFASGFVYINLEGD